MNKTSYDVIIIGAGPAGGRAACALAEKGVRPLIIEKAALPRRKLCAGGITRRGMHLVPETLKHSIEKDCLCVDLHIHDIARRFQSESQLPMISMVSRDRFDHALVLEATRLGAKIMEETNVDRLSFSENKVDAITSKGTFSANYIILADGAHSPLAKDIGWPDGRKLVPAMETEVDAQRRPDLYEKARFDFGFIPGGYAWVFPKKDKISIGMLGGNGATLRRELKRYIRFLGLDGETGARGFRGHPIPMTPRKQPFYRDRILLTGDSAGFVDPLTGEGISLALKSGLLAAKSILNGFPDSNQVETFYEDQLALEITRELRVGKLLANCIYGPTWIRSGLFAIYGPSLCKAMTKVINGEKTCFELTTDFKNYFRLFSRFNLNFNVMQDKEKILDKTTF